MCQRGLILIELNFEYQNLGMYIEMKKMHTVPQKSKNRLFVIFLLIAVNKKSIILVNLKLYIDLKIWQNKLVKNVKNAIFRPFFRKKSKIAKNYTNITTVSHVGKHLIFSILTFSLYF
jgi:hypothetical protein